MTTVALLLAAIIQAFCCVIPSATLISTVASTIYIFHLIFAHGKKGIYSIEKYSCYNINPPSGGQQKGNFLFKLW